MSGQSKRSTRSQHNPHTLPLDLNQSPLKAARNAARHALSPPTLVNDRATGKQAGNAEERKEGSLLDLRKNLPKKRSSSPFDQDTQTSGFNTETVRHPKKPKTDTLTYGRDVDEEDSPAYYSESGPFDFSAIESKKPIFPNLKPPTTPSRKRAISVPPVTPSGGASPTRLIDLSRIPPSPDKSPVRHQLRFTSVPRTLDRKQEQEVSSIDMDVDLQPKAGPSSSHNLPPPSTARTKVPSFTPHRLALLTASPLTPLPPTPIPLTAGQTHGRPLPSSDSSSVVTATPRVIARPASSTLVPTSPVVETVPLRPEHETTENEDNDDTPRRLALTEVALNDPPSSPALPPAETPDPEHEPPSSQTCPLTPPPEADIQPTLPAEPQSRVPERPSSSLSSLSSHDDSTLNIDRSKPLPAAFSDLFETVSQPRTPSRSQTQAQSDSQLPPPNLPQPSQPRTPGPSSTTPVAGARVIGKKSMKGRTTLNLRTTRSTVLKKKETDAKDAAIVADKKNSAKVGRPSIGLKPPAPGPSSRATAPGAKAVVSNQLAPTDKFKDPVSRPVTPANQTAGPSHPVTPRVSTASSTTPGRTHAHRTSHSFAAPTSSSLSKTSFLPTSTATLPSASGQTKQAVNSAASVTSSPIPSKKPISLPKQPSPSKQFNGISNGPPPPRSMKPISMASGLPRPPPSRTASVSTLTQALEKLEKMPDSVTRPGTSLGFAQDSEISDAEGSRDPGMGRPKSALAGKVNGRPKAKDDSHASAGQNAAGRKSIGQNGTGANKANGFKRASTVGPSDFAARTSGTATGASGTGATGRPSIFPSIPKPSRPSVAGPGVSNSSTSTSTSSTKPVVSSASSQKSTLPYSRPVLATKPRPMANGKLTAFGFGSRMGSGAAGPKASKRTTLPTVAGSPVKGEDGAEAESSYIASKPRLPSAFGSMSKRGSITGTGTLAEGTNGAGGIPMDVDPSNTMSTFSKGKGKLKIFQDPDLHELPANAPPSAFKVPTATRMQLDKYGDVFFDDDAEDPTADPSSPHFNPHDAWRRNARTASRRASMASQLLAESLQDDAGDLPNAAGIKFKNEGTGNAGKTQAEPSEQGTVASTETPPAPPAHGRHLRSASTQNPSQKRVLVSTALTGRSAPGGLGKASGSGAHVSTGAARRAGSLAPEKSGGAGKGGSTLNVLKGCVIYVDVRTDSGDDGGELCRDLVEKLGAKRLGRISQNCTHIVWKNGASSTSARWRQMDPKPLVVMLAWVVECAEQRKRLDEKYYLVDLEHVNVAGVHKRRKSFLPKYLLSDMDSPMSPASSGSGGTGTSSGDRSIDMSDGDDPGNTSGRFGDEQEDLPPLERARRRRLAAAAAGSSGSK